MTYSLAFHTALVALAGPDFTWTGTKSSRPESTPRAGLVRYLWEFSGGLCAFCGDALGSDWDICHTVSAGKKRYGYLPGAVAAGCSDCNKMDNRLGHDVVPYETIRRTDLIPTEWPTPAVLRQIGQIEQAHESAIVEAKARKRGMAV